MSKAGTDVGYSVGEIADLTGVTVRALHHYDSIGLLRPSQRNEAGYRFYDRSDQERLQQILFYRELGFSLAEIGTIMSDPEVNAAAHLRRQHKLLNEQIRRLQAMVVAVEHTMEVQKMGISLTPEERFEVFGEFAPEDYAAEAEDRWGDTDAYAQSQRRTARYSKDDWLRIKSEGSELEKRLAAALRNGVASDSEEAMQLAEEHRQQITRNFYDCSFQIHRGLGEMYVADPRFRARYDELASGLAEYLREAIVANADRGEADQG